MLETVAAREWRRILEERLGPILGTLNVMSSQLNLNIFFGFTGDQINIMNAESQVVSSISAAAFQVIGALDAETQEQIIRSLSKMHTISYEMGEQDGISNMQGKLRELIGLDKE